MSRTPESPMRRNRVQKRTIQEPAAQTQKEWVHAARDKAECDPCTTAPKVAIFSSQPIPLHTTSSSRTTIRFKKSAVTESEDSTVQRREELLSPMRRFDQAVKEELKRRREDYCKVPEGSSVPVVNLSLEKNVSTRGLPTHASRSTVQDLERELAPLQMSSALAAAVDCLMKAEQAFYFHGAVRAAEVAADSVPPEKAEEAAAVGARAFKAEIVDTVHDTWEAPNPIEVVGYIGITKPP